MTQAVGRQPFEHASVERADHLSRSDKRLMDAAGRVTGIGPVEIRRRNMVPASAMPYRTSMGTTFDSGDFPRLLAEGLADADWDGFPQRRRESDVRGKRRGSATFSKHSRQISSIGSISSRSPLPRR